LSFCFHLDRDEFVPDVSFLSFELSNANGWPEAECFRLNAYTLGDVLIVPLPPK